MTEPLTPLTAAVLELPQRRRLLVPEHCVQDGVFLEAWQVLYDVEGTPHQCYIWAASGEEAAEHLRNLKDNGTVGMRLSEVNELRKYREKQLAKAAAEAVTSDESPTPSGK